MHRLRPELEIMPDRIRSSQDWVVRFGDGNFTLQIIPNNESDMMNGQLPPSVDGRSVADRSGVPNGNNEHNTGANLTLAINDLVSDGVKNLVISLCHPQVISRPISNMTIASRGVTELDNSKRAKLVISEALPVPTANPGTADIVGFGTAGVVIVRNCADIQKREVIPSFGYDKGWRVDKHVRLIADTTGNKRGDLVGFGEMGVWVSGNNGDNTFQTPKMVLPDFCYAAGWRVEKHPRFMADIRNMGRADIVGFGDNGVYVSLNNGDGTFSPATLSTSFGYNTGWRSERHLRFLADINGNGLLDIVGFGEEGVSVSSNNGDGTFQPSTGILGDFCYKTSWRVEHHPRFVADLTGNGRPDLIGFAEDGVYVAFNNGDGTFQPIRKVLDDFGTAKGWLVEKYPRCIADLTGNGCGDIIGFGEDGVYVAINDGGGSFQPKKLAQAGFCYKYGWSVEQHPRFLVDLTGDGRADILGFASKEVSVSYNDGKGNFDGGNVLITGFGCSVGWPAEKTERYVANLFH